MNWDTKEFLEKVYRKSKSINSVRYYRFGVEDFKRFCDQKGVRVINQKNVYAVIDDYVGSLDKKGLKPKTIKDNVSAVRKFLVYNDIEIDTAKFKNKVTMPRVTKIADEPLTIEAVRTILTKGRPIPRTRALILTLLSSGMRIGEALSIRWKDVNLERNPATISLKAEYVKTREARVVYFSNEAKEAVRETKGGAGEDELVFSFAGDIWQREKEAGHTFRKTVARAGLDDKIEGHRIHKIHFHTFRKFFLTKAVDLLGDHAGHALIGHGFYMDTYYKKSDQEREADYLKLMPRLTVFGKEEISKSEVIAAVRKEMLFAKYSEAEIAKMGDLGKMSNDEFVQVLNRKSMGLNGNGNQKVVPTSEVKGMIEAGWEWVAKLDDAAAVVRLPKTG